MNRQDGFRGWAMALLFWAGTCSGAPLVIDHRHTDVAALTAAQINRAKATLHIAYAHTSHGSQLTDGMSGLVGFANGGGGGLALPADIFAWNNGGAGGALDLHDYAMDGDVGYYPDWVNHTRAYLDDPAHADVNVVVWSWCGQMGDKYAAGTLASEYLQPMAALEQSYPRVAFVYMTGHVDIWDDADNKAACQAIRTWCASGDRVLYDFNDIERYDPDGVYYPYVSDDCGVYDSAGGAQIGNWAVAWQNSHVEGVDWYVCDSAHSEPLNANRKAYAAWHLWCRLAERIQPSVLTVTPASRTYAAAGAAGQQLAVAANGPWTATSSAPWLAISGGAAGTGAGTVTFAAAANAGAARTATIAVSGGGATGTFTACQWPASPFAGLAADGDYDGDGAADVGIYNPASGTWLLALGTGAHWRFAWGGASFMPVPADYNGDGLLDFALYRRTRGTWFIQDSGGSSRKVPFGWGRTVPVPGDYDGDGKADLALFNPDSARWYVQGTAAGGYSAQWGWAGVPTVPVPGDYDGDGAADLAIYHPASGQWFVLQSGSGLMLRKTWGSAAMVPVPADYDGDGKTDVAAFRRATGQWYLALSGGGSRTATLGWASTVPVPADYDGDGRADVAVYNRDSGIWYVVESATGVLTRRTWGWRGTLPVHPLPWIHAWFGLP